MKIGDVSRTRRMADPARRRWYAYHRSVRFARRLGNDPDRPGLASRPAFPAAPAPAPRSTPAPC